MISGVTRILLQGARVRGARVPKFVVTKSSRSESYLALGLQNLRAFANSRGHVLQCTMPGDVTDYDDRLARLAKILPPNIFRGAYAPKLV